METKALEIENLKEQIFELQQENHSLMIKYIDFKREKDLQIARLQDKLEFASEQADTFAKSLKKIYEEIEVFQSYFPNMDEFLLQRELNEDVDLSIFDRIKNSIPENALRRAE